jgi:hypothetical protein
VVAKATAYYDADPASNFDGEVTVCQQLKLCGRLFDSVQVATVTAALAVDPATRIYNPVLSTASHLHSIRAV